MENSNGYFNSALSNFIFDFSCGDAIRHLADSGYSSAQIAERMDYPLSVARVREAVTEYFLEKGILLRNEPSCEGSVPEQFEYVLDHDKFGKPSFRRVQVEAGNAEQTGHWTEQDMTSKEAVEFLKEYDAEWQEENGRTQANSYVSCDYGRLPADSEVYEALNERQREYLRGILWSRKRMYHLLDVRMKEIVLRLCERELYEGKIYLVPERKIITVG